VTSLPPRAIVRRASEPAPLDVALAAAATPACAAAAVVTWLAAQGLPLTGIYVEAGGRLRGLAVRGFSQVLEGFPRGRGVMGAACTTGEEQHVEDAARDATYLPSIPGMAAEVCLPLRWSGAVIGVLNAELPRPFADAEVDALRVAATAFEARLASLGGFPAEGSWQRLARRTAELAALTDTGCISAAAVEAACEVTHLSSALLVVQRHGGLAVEAAHGPLGDALRALPREALPVLASWTADATSSYTLHGQGRHGLDGHELVRAAGAAAFATAALLSAGTRHGFVLVADALPIAIDATQVQQLEVIATHVSGALHTAAALDALRHEAQRDALTGLGHGGTFQADLGGALAVPGTDVGVALVDLDHFKQVNDTRGHLVGDRVLRATADALSRAVGPHGRLYRVGGDEFAAILPGIGEEELALAATRLLAAARATETTVSIGTTLVAGGTRATSDEVLAQADLALYETKRRGRDGATRYRPALRTAVIERARLAADLAAAIERRDLTVVYQPVVDLADGETLGVEALVRWDHPTRGPIPPVEFIPIAEEDGLVEAIGAFVLEEAAAQLARWDAEGWGRPDMRMGFNVAASEIGPGLLTAIRSALDRHGLLPERLVVEVTESMLVDGSLAAATLQRLRDLGVHVAVDDFGTGYSSLSYLRALPIDILKIDRSFVAELADPTNRAVVQAIIDLASTLELSIVAEGIESRDQVDALVALGCEHGQGYLFTRPVPGDEIPAAALAARAAFRPGTSPG
jgi:diguanylate cyclase (GGDEF)-like protein